MRKFRVRIMLAGWCLGGVLHGARSAELTLVEDGQARATIVLAAEPVRAAQLAAFELQEHIRLITGATLPIVDEHAAVDGVKLFVGRSNAAGVPDDFQNQEYAIQFRPDAVVMAGQDKHDVGAVTYWHSGTPRIEGAHDYTSWPDLFDAKGTLHAVYTFLEDFCGVRWFNPGEFGTDVPATPTLTVTAAADVRRAPAFRYRDYNGLLKQNMELYNRGTALWTIRWCEPTPKYHEWLALMYEKGKQLPVCAHPHRWLGYERSHVFAFLTRRRLGGEPFKTNHSLYDWYDRFWALNTNNPSVFVGPKPDWFAQGYPDAKVPPQLCYTHPEVVQQCIADARAFFALPPEERSKRRLGTDEFFPVVPMDNGGYCQCDRCAALSSDSPAGAFFSRGTHSTLVWSFVNQVARGLRETHPDKMVSALAYASYARRPPDLPIEDNIAVQLCLFPRATTTSPGILANDDAMLREWGDGRPLYLWLYTSLTTGHMPGDPMFPVFMGDLYGGVFDKYLRAGVRGVFFNGMPPAPDDYLLLKLADDPGLDFARLREDYFVRMYGPLAGKTLETFYNRMAEIGANPRHYPTGVSGAALWWGVLGTAPRMAELEALVTRAEGELAGAPENWNKRFAIFKLGVWDYMKEGRTRYEASKIAKASAPVTVTCPLTIGNTGDGDPGQAEWRDAQGFGVYNGWLKDNGDVSLRRISAGTFHDGQRLYLRFVESELERAPAAGDRWEIVFFDRAAGPLHRLFVDAAGAVSGQTQGSGVPQEWADHGARAASRVSDGRWEAAVVLPIPRALLDERGHLFLNGRRHDATGEDSPVLVATGNEFEAGKTGALIVFDAPPADPAAGPADGDLIVDLDVKGDAGEAVKDRSGKGNDGLVVGAFERDPEGLVFTGTQYLELEKMAGFNPSNFTFSCWLKYPDVKQPGGARIFTWGALYLSIAKPHGRLIFNWPGADGKLTGRGPGGVELTPKQWHLLTLTHDGRDYVLYENGRSRMTFGTRALPTPGPDSVWRIGGEPKLPPWYSFTGTFGQLRFYGRALSAGEVMGTYAEEYEKRR